MPHNFAAIILGGTGQVGGATVEALLAIPQCREVIMLTRKPIQPRARIRNIVLESNLVSDENSSAPHPAQV